MTVEFALHDASTAPAGSRPALERAQQRLGMVPNLYRVMAESPALLKAYHTLSDILAESSLSPIEQQVVYQTVANAQLLRKARYDLLPTIAGQSIDPPPRR